MLGDCFLAVKEERTLLRVIHIMIKCVLILQNAEAELDRHFSKTSQFLNQNHNLTTFSNKTLTNHGRVKEKHGSSNQEQQP